MLVWVLEIQGWELDALAELTCTPRGAVAEAEDFVEGSTRNYAGAQEGT